MREEGSRVKGQDIPLEEVRAGAFRVLLKYLYTHELPVGEETEEQLGELAAGMC